MNLLIVLIFSVFCFVAFGQSNAVLSCYSCSGKGSECPKTASQADLDQMTKVDCDSTLSTVCAKYSFDLLNGESYTYRSCEPTYIGGTAQEGAEFCTFITNLYTPVIAEGLIKSSSCQICLTLDCNT